MNRINKLFQKKNKKILSIYFTAGYPRINDSVDIIKALDKNGVDMIEVGIPFSDPIADGPIIQNSSTIAIKNGMNMSLLFDQLKNIRSTTQIPIILMGYINPIIQFGYDKFVDKLIDCGIDGVILPDLPLLEYKKELKPFFDKNNISFVSLISPNTSIERVKEIDQISDGFLYVVSSSSITGQNNLFDVNQIKYFNSLNNIFLKNPKIIGFGISDKKSFNMACNYSNGAIIGTKFINSLDVLNLNKSIEKFINSILL
ncbi:MAG: tryptophan synthase subunit alpha [Bacteroidota bacterium]|uniref:tryptophan synthase n=1 Tax=marine metagenome TaxID=408172 RepID=A0A381NH44_9ZZZZ|nr:tryptophan synthase subunit alpha [Bacteroidota bacterium]|tara:strand:+ start:152 stop:922 length:771 start_codon:yes stop_codon:yes gene_type:complete